MGQKILLAIDDSENAIRAVEFVANTFTADSRITLFNVVQDTATMCEMNSPELTPYFTSQQSSFCLLEEKKKELVTKDLQKGKTMLLDAGFEEKNILLKDNINKLGKLPLLHEPGERYHYGLEMDVLGRLVEIWSGLPLDEFFRQRIFVPLGMNDTHFYLPEEKSKPIHKHDFQRSDR